MGAIISSLVLTPAPDDIREPTDDELEMCGLNDCPGSNYTNSNFDDLESSVVSSRIGIQVHLLFHHHQMNVL